MQKQSAQAGALVTGHNAILLAGDIGRVSNYWFGEGVCETLEVSAILRMTKRRAYDSGIRMRSNSLVIAPPGAGKTFLTEQFYQRALDGVNLFSPDAQRTERERGPRILFLTQSTSWERVRGAFTSTGDVELPLLCDSDFVVAPELMDFLGGERDRSEKMDKLNVMTEEGRITVAQVKGGEIDEESAKEIRQRCAHLRGFYYSPYLKGFSYEVDTAFTGCTRPPKPKIEREWRESGYFSRHDVFWWEPGDEEYKAYLQKEKRPPNFSKLVPINRAIWRTEFKSIPEPPEHLMAPLREWIVSEYGKIAKHTARPITEFGNLRDIFTVMRVMTAHAIARIFAARDLADTTPVETIEYTQADADFAKRYFERRIGHLAMKMQTLSTDDGNEGCPDWAVDMMRKFLASVHTDADDYHQEVARTAFFAHVTGVQGKKPGPARNALSLLKKHGHLTYGRGADQIHLDTSFMLYLGYKPQDQGHQESQDQEQETDQT